MQTRKKQTMTQKAPGISSSRLLSRQDAHHHRRIHFIPEKMHARHHIFSESEL
jgi:hypothetical protein